MERNVERIVTLTNKYVLVACTDNHLTPRLDLVKIQGFVLIHILLFLMMPRPHPMSYAPYFKIYFISAPQSDHF